MTALRGLSLLTFFLATLFALLFTLPTHAAAIDDQFRALVADRPLAGSQIQGHLQEDL